MPHKAAKKPYSGPAGGWGSVNALARILTQAEVPILGGEILWKQNSAVGAADGQPIDQPRKAQRPLSATLSKLPMQRLRHFLDWLRARLWLIPALMSVAAVASVFVLLSAGQIVPTPDGKLPWWLFSGDASTARDLLSTLLSGMITMTSLVVSITIVVLSLAAGQLGPRLIWNFIGDRQIQSVIGLFIATILYILLVLRSINEALGPEHVPQVAVTIASALAIACMFALLFLVNKLARSIVSDTIVREVADRLDAAISLLPCKPASGERDATEFGIDTSAKVAFVKSGYVQFADYDTICDFASERDVLVRVNVRPGEFALRGSIAVSIEGRNAVTPDKIDRLLGAISLGPERTPSQDLEYSVRQLVEVAVRALSPSLNDPFTAIAVIDRLASALESLASRAPPRSEFRDSDGRLRVVSSRTGFADFFDAALSPIRRAAAGHVIVLVRLACRMADLFAIVPPSNREPILKHLHILKRQAANLTEPEDRRLVLDVIEPALSIPPKADRDAPRLTPSTDPNF
jgi:uncharacterized membrane protein